jgi:hypothetical protein
MSAVTYQPPDILHWFDTGSAEAIETSKKIRPDLNLGSGKAIKETMMQAAAAAAEFGRGAMADLAWRRLDEVSYTLDDDSFEAITLTTHRNIPYETVVEIIAEKHDKFLVRHEEGTLTIRPIAHLASSGIRVPIGWKRAGIEVPYLMLIEFFNDTATTEIYTE